LVISARDAPPGCAALLVDREVSRRLGAIAMRRLGERFEISATRSAGYDRPWAPAMAYGSEVAEPRRPTPAGAQPRDATPRQEDLEPGD
jgi:competence protein ComEC